MIRAVLNAWSATFYSEGSWLSKIVLEATALPNGYGIETSALESEGPHEAIIEFKDLGLAMAPDEIPVLDGLVRSFRIEPGPFCKIRVLLELPSSPVVHLVPGLPARIELVFSRDAVSQKLNGSRVTIDPGHGGSDVGFRGPVNLLEKDVCLAVALELDKLFKQTQALSSLIRESDVDLPLSKRLRRAKDCISNFYISIHCSGYPGTEKYSRHVRFPPSSDRSRILAELAAKALEERFNMKVSVLPSDFLEEHHKELGGIPVIQVEPVCLTYFADEANFRAPLYRKRIAQSLFNAVVRYISHCPGI